MDVTAPRVAQRLSVPARKREENEQEPKDPTRQCHSPSCCKSCTLEIWELSSQLPVHSCLLVGLGSHPQYHHTSAQGLPRTVWAGSNQVCLLAGGAVCMDLATPLNMFHARRAECSSMGSQNTLQGSGVRAQSDQWTRFSLTQWGPDYLL